MAKKKKNKSSQPVSETNTSRRSVSVEKATNGYVVRGYNDKDFKDVVYVEKTKTAANQRALKML